MTISYLRKMLGTIICDIQLSHVNVLSVCFYGYKENSIEYSHTDISSVINCNFIFIFNLLKVNLIKKGNITTGLT